MRRPAFEGKPLFANRSKPERRPLMLPIEINETVVNPQNAGAAFVG